MRHLTTLLFLLSGASLHAQSGMVTVSNIRADALSHSSLRLIWDNSTPINAIRVRYGFSNAYDLGPGGAVLTPGTSQFSQFNQTLSISGLQPSTQYHFCPQASADGGRTWSDCADFSAATLPLPDVHPAPPQPPVEFDVRYPNQTRATVTASADCSNLQDLMNQAHYGDTILIPAGTTCSDSYVLPSAPEAIRFLPQDVDTASDQISLPGHGFPDGQKVHLDTEGCLPGSAGSDVFCQFRGILPGDDYFVERVDADHIRLKNAAGARVGFSVASFVADPLSGTLTLSAADPVLRDGLAIQVRSSGVLPDGLQSGTTYYVVNPSSTKTIQLALGPGGPPVLIGNSGQGEHFLCDPGSGRHAIMAWPPANNWIVVRTATPDEQFCPQGVRCLGGIWASKMARIAQTSPPSGTLADVRLFSGILSHGWRFVGIEFTHADNSAAAATSTDPTPYYGFLFTRRTTSNLILDRCYIHGLGFPNRIYRAIVGYDGTNMAIINSDLEKLDLWHPAVSPRNGMLPSITGSQTAQIAPGIYYMGVKQASITAPVTITLTGGTTSGTAIVYFDLKAILHVDLPKGIQGACSAANCIVTATATDSPAYPNDASGNIAVAQITDLNIVNGNFTSFAYRASSPLSRVAVEGSPSFIAGNGPGPFLIQNNTISSTGLPIHFDDSGGDIYDRHDYVVRRNLFTAPLSQQGGGPLSDGLHYSHRNMLEWKGGQRILVEGNIFEHNFADVSPLGAPLVLTPRAGGYITDVMIRNNTFRYNAGGILLAPVDSYSPISKPLERVAVVNNLFHHNDGYAYASQYSRDAATGILFYYGYASADLNFDHNTLFDNRGFNPVFLHLVLQPLEGVSITNNFLWVNDDAGRRGIDGESYSNCLGVAKALLDCALVSGVQTSYTFRRNVLLPGWSTSGPTASGLLSPDVLGNAYAGLAENWILNGTTLDDRVAQAGFAGFLSDASNDYRFSAGSPFASGGPNSATDGKAIGADPDQLNIAQGTISPPFVSVDGTSVTVSAIVPDAGPACYVLYGTGKDISSFARTAADTSQSNLRSLTIAQLDPASSYNFTMVCDGATNYSSGSFSTPAASTQRN